MDTRNFLFCNSFLISLLCSEFSALCVHLLNDYIGNTYNDQALSYMLEIPLVVFFIKISFIHFRESISQGGKWRGRERGRSRLSAEQGT